jgi:hypothetical protein
MFRMFVVIDKREDLSEEEFREYYETKHIPFIAKTAPAKVVRYRRNYVLGGHPLGERLTTERGDAPSSISAITEIGFETEEDAAEMVERLTSPEVRDAVIADEANFIAPGGVRWHVVRDDPRG